MYRCLLLVLLLPGVLPAEEGMTEFTMPRPPGPHCPVSSEQLKKVESYRVDQPLVGTHFFYWYDIESKAHFVNHDGSDALTDHPARHEGYSYKSVAWWKRELLDVRAAGIDFILPVYWGYPGAYDHSAVPNRKPLVVDREGGAFYEALWKQFLAYSLKRRAKVVLVETWNELHEGTDVCHSKEFGRQYIELTAKYAKLFRDNAVLPKTGPFANAGQVEWDASHANEKLGITMKNFGDGLVDPFEVGGRRCWRSKQSENGGKYVYFDLDDNFMFDEEDATLLVEIEYLDGGFGAFAPEYDSIDPGASVREGAFRPLGQSVACGHTGKWKTATLKINGGRFANRCNGGDFRLALTGGDLAVGRVTAKRG